MTEQNCYLKRMDYYDFCNKCKGESNNPCYATKSDVMEHLKDFRNHIIEEGDKVSIEELILE